MIRKAKRSSAANFDGSGLPGSVFGRCAFAIRGAAGEADGSGALAGLLSPPLALLFSAVLLLAAAPAAQAGKVPGFGVLGTGTTGSGAGQLSAPKGVSANTAGSGPTAGHVYVSDSGNNRISEFTASGTFVRAFGLDVDATNPSTGYEICEAPDVCQAGSFSSIAGGIAEGQGVAVDPATGNVFLADNTSKRINVYSATGQFEGAFGWKVNAASPEEKLQLCTFVTGCQAGSSGAGAGQFAALSGTSTFPSSPAISPLNGDLFVPSPGNRRVDEFGLTLNGSKEVTGVSYVKGFGGDVVPTINEKQTATIANATGGTFALAFNSKSTDVAGTGDVKAGSNEIANFSSPGAKFAAGEEVFGAGIPAGTRITAVTFDSLTLSAAATQTANGVALTAALPFNATAANVQAALQGLSTIGSGNVAVTGCTGTPTVCTVEFKGALAGTDVAQLAGDGSKLTGSGPSLAIATTQAGANGAGTGYEVCTVATSCKAGAAPADQAGLGGGGTFRNGSPTSVAVDSAGSIYATGQPEGANTCLLACRVQKFNPAATSVEELAPAQLTGAASASPNAVAPTRVAIDPANDHVLVLKWVSSSGTAKVFEFTKAGTPIDISPPSEAGVFAAVGLSAGTGGLAYLVISIPGQVKIIGSPPAPKAAIDPVSAIGQTTATFSGVAQPSAPGIEGGFPTVAYFEYSADGITWAQTEPVSIGDGTGAGSPNSCPTGNPPSCNVSRTVFGLQPGKSYLVRMVVSNGTAATSPTTSFETPAAAPSVSGMAASPAGQTSATINGLVNPNNRPTTYHFEWGPDTSYGTRIPADIDVVAGSGGQPVPASANLTGLQPATTYHFRVVAKSSGGTTIGPDGEFTTLNSKGLPDDRGIELVSPADKRPAGGVRPLFFTQLMFQAAEDGDSIFYPILNGIDGSTASGTVIFASGHSSAGWLAAQQVTPPSLLPSPQNQNEADNTRSGSVRYGNPRNLNCSVVESHNPLSDDTPAVDLANEVTNLYRWSRSSGKYTLITNLVPTNPTAAGSSSIYFKVMGANEDCSRIFFRSQAFTYIPGSSGLYEWDNGILRDAGKLPNGAVPAGGVPDKISNNMVSPSGRLFFVATSNQAPDSGKQAVFVRKSPTETVDVSRPTTAVTPGGAMYETASSNGSSVFFLSNYGLASTSSAGPTNGFCSATTFIPGTEACDLYRWHDDGSPTGQLTDISVDPNPVDPQGATVQGVMDVSGDGSTAYFAARGQLVPGAGRTYAQNLQGAGFANIYRWHSGQLSYVGSVTVANLNGVVSTTGGALVHNPANFWTSQTTDDGDWFLYASDEATAANPNGAREAYLYSAETGRTECVSCPTDGAVPISHSENFGSNTLIQRMQGDEAFMRYTPRSLSDDGRVFFTSFDKLTADAVPSNGNIYEWHRGQLSLLTSASAGSVEFIDSGGPNGRDVFIRSFDRLDSRDVDTVPDLYDFRAGGGFGAVTPEPTPCDPANGACQGAPSGLSDSPSPASSNFSGAGNPPLQPPRCPKGSVRKHGKCVKKHKRHRTHNRAANTDHGGAK